MAPRPKLSREKILRVALRLASEAGLEGMTIRRLTAELGVTPMAVYRHFENKAEIVDGLLEVVIGDSAPSAHEEDDWREWLLETFLRMYDALVETPAVIPLLGSSASFGFHALEQMERVLTVMMREGMSAEESARSYQLMISYTIGAAAMRTAAHRQMKALGQAPERLRVIFDEQLRAADVPAFPHVLAAAPHLSSFTSREQFKRGVEMLIMGLKAPSPRVR